MRLLLLLAALALGLVAAVDKSKFKTCEQSSFCKDNRQIKQEGHYRVIEGSLSVVEHGHVAADLGRVGVQDASPVLSLNFFFYDNLITRVRIVEKHGVAPRYEPEGVLLEEALRLQPVKQLSQDEVQGCSCLSASSLARENDVFFSLARGSTSCPSSESPASIVGLRMNPFRVDFFVDGELAMTTNDRGYFYFEHMKVKDEAGKAANEGQGGYAEPDPGDAGEGEGAVEEQEEGEEEKHKDEEPKKDEKIIVDYGEHGRAIYADGTEEEAGSGAGVVHDTRSVQGDDAQWQERFGRYTDHKRFGRTSVGVDLDFPMSSVLFGLPEHATALALSSTVGEEAKYHEPYRLFNLDVFEYELYVPMALYGSIPLLVGHGPASTVAAFWLNAADTFVDVLDLTRPAAAATDPHTDGMSYKGSRWMSESGAFDLFFLPGPRPSDVSRRYASLTGVTSIPPAFSLGYHQCRWNYRDEKDVREVDEGFETRNIPYDVLWLDIEHTDGKRYFTWDPSLFSTPAEMQHGLSAHGRKMVSIVDPHVKRDGGYDVHAELSSKGFYIKDRDGRKDYEGWCWPGSSSYPDFTAREVRDWWASRFDLDAYAGSTPDLYTWNDMNEPSVFNGPEVSMPRDCRNLAGVEHREWHNLFGFYFHQSSFEGQLYRSLRAQLPSLPSSAQSALSSLRPSELPSALPEQPPLSRPFVLSRAFFAGSQRWGAVWTGDNAAEWSHLAASEPMLLAISVAGLPFCGADVGGFFGNPDGELSVRWYQAGAYQPFFRGHSHIDTARREPWVFGEPYTSLIREAILARYALLPYWYTLFAEHEQRGTPVMRPLWYHYPQNEATFHIDDQHLVGEDLLVKPVVEKGAESSEVFLPGPDEWYDTTSYQVHEGGQRVRVQTPLSVIPVFQRGGSIIPKRPRVRRSASLMHADPYTLMVAVDANKQAFGRLYVDDGHSDAYRSGHFVVQQYQLVDGVLSSLPVSGDLTYNNNNNNNNNQAHVSATEQYSDTETNTETESAVRAPATAFLSWRQSEKARAALLAALPSGARTVERLVVVGLGAAPSVVYAEGEGCGPQSNAQASRLAPVAAQEGEAVDLETQSQHNTEKERGDEAKRSELTFQYDEGRDVLTVKKPPLALGRVCKIWLRAPSTLERPAVVE